MDPVILCFIFVASVAVIMWSIYYFQDTSVQITYQSPESDPDSKLRSWIGVMILISMLILMICVGIKSFFDINPITEN